MQLSLGYGSGDQIVTVEDERILDILTPNRVELSLTGEREVRRALEEPIGTPRLREILRPGEKIAIVTSDITRPMPTAKVMDALLEEIYGAGVEPKDVTLVFALGSHRKHRPEEMLKLAGERAIREIRCVDSDTEDCVRMGTTARGTPVDITRVVAEADRRICLGNIEYHYFAGYSGGGKALMPGVSTRSAIRCNHSLMVDERACAGRMQGNPLREDIEEAAAMVGIDFILNLVLDEHKEIVKAVAGHPIEAHRAGCRFLDSFYLKEIPARADIVLVSQGGSPKDLNLYQTQKALDNAKHAVKPGGVVVLIGACDEGFGEDTFEEWMREAESPDSLIRRIRQDFKLGGHKAAAIAMVLKNADIYFVSRMEPDLVRSIFLTPFDSVQKAYDAARAKLGEKATVLVMPYGGSTLPRVREKAE